MKYDHVALTVPEGKVRETVAWYVENMSAKVKHVDDTWGLVSCHGTDVAFVIPKQHPPHIAFILDNSEYEQFKNEGKVFKIHRDGSESFYDKDCQGNILEFLFWPRKIG
jgi:catechol 2,3-dioxygenase-like lactoylglutathione lyase family enzyme